MMKTGRPGVIPSDGQAARQDDTDHFAKGRNPYKVFLVFLVGSFTGFLVETVVCLATAGHFEWRSGIVYMPFNPVYGFGAATLYLVLYNFRNTNVFAVFIVGAVSGSLVEYLCSFIQEKAFGTVSWDYSQRPFNIGSRICLKYAVAWGILAIVWVDFISPLLDVLISKIPSGFGKPFTVIMFFVLFVFSAVSVTAIVRWNARRSGAAALNRLGSSFDRFFPDEKMKFFYPNMMFR